jgi:hypothetical protein
VKPKAGYTRAMKIANAAVFLISISALISNASVCDKGMQGKVLRVTAVGDILIHQALYRAVVSSQDDFSVLWRNLIPTLSYADLTVGNLEGPTAPGVSSSGRIVSDPGFVYDGDVYSGTNFRFNYHPSLLESLKKSGFDLVTTANNHSLDRGTIGVEKTIDQLKYSGLNFVGSRKSRDQSQRGSFTNVLHVKGYKVGVIACTESLNGWPDPYNTILKCGDHSLPTMISDLKSKTDLVLVFPHWGDEYQLRPAQRQKNWARQWVNAGANAIIGNHPHVLQTVEKIDQAIVIYSLGNFVAGQGALEKRATALAHIDFELVDAEFVVSQFSYTPAIRPRGSLALQKVDSDRSTEGLNYIRSQMGPSFCKNF